MSPNISFYLLKIIDIFFFYIGKFHIQNQNSDFPLDYYSES